MFIHIDTSDGYKVIAHNSEILYVPEFAEYIKTHGWNCFQYLIYFSSYTSPFAYLEPEERNLKVIEIVKKYPMDPMSKELKKFHRHLYQNLDYKVVETILLRLTFDADRAVETTLVRKMKTLIDKIDDTDLTSSANIDDYSKLTKILKEMSLQLREVQANIAAAIKSNSASGMNMIGKEIEREFEGSIKNKAKTDGED